jgi:hypothetical protein
MNHSRLLLAVGIQTFALLACAEASDDSPKASPATGGRQNAGSGGQSGLAGQASAPSAGKGGALGTGGNRAPLGGSSAGEINDDEPSQAGGGAGPESPSSGGAAGSQGSSGSAGAAGSGNSGVCVGGEACPDYVLHCQPAACTNGHVPFCYCGGGEQPVVECHEGGETC